jgi:hypothetical protein
MDKVELVYAIKQKMYDISLSSYRNTYEKEVVDKVKEDNEYIKSIKFFQSLTKEEKDCLFFLIETSIWDTISNFLGWLDGVYYFKEQTESCALKFEKDKKKLNGYLQDIWMNIFEGETREYLEKFYKDL